ncbi:MAG: twin-arginine translocation signal domain-containing protein, partial [Chloroflexota bacterium]|nr:twin-arginine translocation signal domain-containing protein [Chloroflexota bacterium]
MTTTLSRRTFLKAGAIAGVSLAVPWSRYGAFAPVAQAAGWTPLNPARLSKYTEQLPIPPVLSPSAFTFGNRVHDFHSMLRRVPTFGYNGATYLGPTFEAQRGSAISLTWTNALGAHPVAGAGDATLHGAEETDKTVPRAAVHLHGGHV